jgi:Ca-activated chloride channel family protein
MSLFRYPPQPLSITGRVLLCIAMSILAAVLMMISPPSMAHDSDAPKAESPYFFVDSREPGLDRLPLKSTKVDVRINGVIADVTVTQQYRNEGQRAIDARYVFPGSTRSAVYAMNVRLGDRLVTARIKEKQAARIEYDAARKEGKTAALLDQKRPNVFEMNVANILPGDEVAVELRYTELLTPQDAVYGFVFPTVVGPRYNSPDARPANGGAVGGAVGGALLREGQTSTSAFALRVAIDSPIGIKEISSPSHDILSTGIGANSASVVLRDPEVPANNRDFILNYRLAGDRIESGVMLFRGPDLDGAENFFLAMVQPPKAIATRQINPREYIFVVDISGSMHGQPLDTAKTLLRNLVGGLRASDTFNVMLFSGSSRMLAPQSVPATRANIDQAVRALRGESAGGGTEIVPALKKIASMPKSDDVSRTVIVITDGYVSVESEVFQLIRQNLDRCNVFAFGIGSSVNRHLIEGIARAGQGEAFVVTKASEAAEQAERLRRMIASPVLTQVSTRFEGLDVYDIEPPQLPDVLGGRPVVVFGKWRGNIGGGARLVVEGRSADGAYRDAVALSGRDDQTSTALRLLWARQRIASLSDQEAIDGGTAQKSQITALGLQYGLLTQYTSFLAVDKLIRNSNPALSQQVEQPSPLPEGVSNLAIGAEVPSTPEPAAWAALLVVIGIVGATLWSRRDRG